MACPICKTPFHACSACGYTYSWEYEFCSIECYHKSERYVLQKDQIERFVNSLSTEQKTLLMEIIQKDVETTWDDLENYLRTVLYE